MAENQSMTYDPTALLGKGTGMELAVATFDALPIPAYLTDADGVLIYYNPACIEFAGEAPTIGIDRWCVARQLYSFGGKPLPSDQWPLAAAIRERRTARGIEALAKRPDGYWICFEALSTALFDEEWGGPIMAIILCAIMDRYIQHLHAQIQRCERLARASVSEPDHQILESVADEYRAQLAVMRPSGSPVDRKRSH